MSLLILPRPERVTMPAAILPRPDKKKIGAKVKKTTGENTSPTMEKVETTDEISPANVEKIESSVAPAEHSIVPKDSAVISSHCFPVQIASSSIPDPSTAIDAKDTPSIEPPTIGMKAPVDAAQLLLQLVDILRTDGKALSALKSLIDGGLAPKSSSAAAEIVPFEKIEASQTPAIHDTFSTPPVEDIAAAVESQPPPATERKSPGIIEVPPEQPAKVVQSEIVVYPTRKSKDHSKSKECTSHKHKSKHPKHTKEFIAQCIDGADVSPVPQGFTAVGTAVDIIDEELARDDFWYFVPETKDQHDDEVSPKGIYTLQDLKNHPRRGGPVRKLYEPPAFPVKGKLPFPIDGHSGSTEAYDATFQKVDAKDDLGVMSKLKSDPTVLDKPIHLKPASTRKPIEEKKSDTTTLPVKPAPVMFDFNPPSPRRVTRRVVLSSKEVGTQTSSPSSAAAKPPSSSAAASRPIAIHHERYYSNALRIDAKSSAKVTKRAPFTPLLTPEELKNIGAKWTGSDKVFMGTLKNVDAGDDLMIVSKAKEQEKPKIEPPVQESFPVIESPIADESPVAVDPTAAFHESLIKAITQDDGTLYALLTALSKTSPAPVPPAPPASVHSAEKKDKKEKKEKKEKPSSKEGKAHKSKSKKTIPEDAKEGDIFGDLLGDEMPKWGILNPTA